MASILAPQFIAVLGRSDGQKLFLTVSISENKLLKQFRNGYLPAITAMNRGANSKPEIGYATQKTPHPNADKFRTGCFALSLFNKMKI